MKRWELMVSGAIEVVSGLCTLGSFGFWIPKWEMEWCCHCALKECRKRINALDKS